MNWLKMILAALFGAVGDWLLAWRRDRQANAAKREAAVNEAALETQQVITETADARSKLRPADDSVALARRMRERAARETKRGGDE